MGQKGYTSTNNQISTVPYFIYTSEVYLGKKNQTTNNKAKKKNPNKSAQPNPTQYNNNNNNNNKKVKKKIAPMNQKNFFLNG